MTKLQRGNPGLVVLIVALCAAVATIDLTTRLGLAIWVFYVAPLALSLFLPKPMAPVVVGAVAGLLTVIGYLLSSGSPYPEIERLAPLNRAFVVAVLLVFGFIGRQFIANRVRLLEQDWIKAGHTGLSLRMQGELRIEELAGRALSFLAEYVGAQVGHFFITDDAGVLVHRAAFAAPPPPGDAAAVRLGESLVGQVAADNRVLLVHDLPPDYVQVSSGTGAARPRALLLVPTRVDDRVNGVIELGFFRAPSPHERAFLESVAELVGVAVRSARYRAQQAELLEETQRQAEELQAQQEELRATNEELAEQGRALKESHERLQDQQAELEETNAELEQQARALELQKQHLSQTQDMLVEKAAELERASRYKSEFLANMSHELRTPLNSALILAKLLFDNRTGNLTAEQVQYARNIYAAGMDLLTLINDILDLSKIEAGKLDLNFEVVDLRRLLEELRQRFEPLAAERQLAFSMHVEPGCPAALETDPLRLRQVLTNLLSNAVKFTPSGSISLRASPGPGDELLIAVTDTGIGIAPEQHEIIFEAFRQADGTTMRRFGGTGLGLSICRELADLLGGSIRLRSAPGQGSTFTLVLPRARRAAAAQPPRLAEPTKTAPAPAPAQPAPARPAAPIVPDDRDVCSAGGRTVLLIEDDPVFAGVLRDLARELGFQCIAAGGADEGLELARRFRPGAIILDIGLPDHSGLTILELLKRDPATRHIPIHIISAHDYQRAARELGAVGYALKPIQREGLIAAFRRLERQIARRSRRVLVVEDDAVQREAIEKLLGSEGVQIFGAATADEALARLKSDEIDCVVLDLMLPGTSGFELLDRVARDQAQSCPPVIVYTARALTLDEEQRLRRHAKSIIIKGARSPERLLEEVTLFLHQVEAELPPQQRELLRAALDRESVFVGRRILVVEDDVRNIFALTSALEPRGAVIEVARNGKEAVQRVAAAPAVDLVLMDIMMPEMDGLEATRAIRKDPRCAGLPIIALTAKAMPDDREQCLLAGANDYIAKPIDIEKLISLVRVWMPR